MTDRAEELIEEALSLSAEDRERIGIVLLDSIDDDSQREVVNERIDQIERGDVAADDAMSVYQRLRSRRRA